MDEKQKQLAQEWFDATLLKETIMANTAKI